MKKLLLLLAAACCIASCAEIRTTYIGKAYPTTGTAPELYFDRKDVPSDYETMGSIKATPFGKTLEEAQAGLDAWLESAFPDAGIRAADFDAVRGDDRCTFSTQLKNGQLLDGHYAGTYMAICYDKEQGVTFFSYHEY